MPETAASRALQIDPSRFANTASTLYALALAEFVAKDESGDITARLDDTYEESASDLDPAVREAQSRPILAEWW